MKLSDAQIKAMNNLLDRYQSGTPRCLQVQKTDMPCVIFTDGACEHGKSGELLCSIGGVIFDPACESTIEAFGAYVSDEVVESWMRAEKVHPVSQTEMYAECVARYVWKRYIDGRRCLFFIDNQGDLDALIKGYSMEDTMKELLVMLESLDSENPCLPWYCRVPSSSNISDLPSRGRWDELFSLFPECKRIDAFCPFNSGKLQEI